MSAKDLSEMSLSGKTFLSKNLPVTTPWVRHPAWIALPTVLTTDHKFVGLHAVYPESNFLALSAAGNYTVDWGDGSAAENINSDVVAYHEYSYADADLNNTNGPVTFQGSADTVTRTNHGFTDGMRVTFYNIATTTGIVDGQIYYVRDATANTFKVSATSGGAAVDLVNDGTGALLPYKQAIVVVTPQAGQTFSALNLHVKHNQTNLQTYSSGFLDIALAGADLTDVRIGWQAPGNSTLLIRFADLERVNLVKTNLRQCAGLFASCVSLMKVIDVSTTSDAPLSGACTFTDAGDLVTFAGHGRRNGDSVIFTTINSTTGISVNTRYFVISATTDTFQVSSSFGGSALALTTDGSGTAVFGTDFSSMFSGCSSLQSIPLLNTASGTNFNSMFANCSSLQSIPLLNTASGTNFSSMFQSCSSLQSIPLLNTAAGTNFSNMFGGCSSLQSIPLLNTASGTNFSSMFVNCSSLQSIPLLNTAAGTTFSIMFSGCSSLQSIPLLNTASGTNFSSMFQSCSSLQSIPLLNTAAGTNFSNMFNSCRTLQSIPLLNTAAGTDFSSMFSGCSSLQSIPLLNTASGTNFNSMFANCSSLQSIPLLNTAAGTDFSSMFQSCSSTASIDVTGTRLASFSVASCKLSEAALTNIIEKLGNTASTQTLTISSNYGAVTPISLSGTTTAGSTTITMANTSGIQTGMQVTGTGTPSTTARAVTFTDAGDTVGLTAHGLSNGDEVSFATIVTTTGIAINTIYFVVNATTDTFQVALTAGGGAIALTSNGTGTLRYKATVTAINPNVSVTLSRPATSSGTNTLAFRTLKTNTALLKGWSVTG